MFQDKYVFLNCPHFWVGVSSIVLSSNSMAINTWSISLVGINCLLWAVLQSRKSEKLGCCSWSSSFQVLPLEAGQKCFKVLYSKSQSRSGYRIFEEYVYSLVTEVREKRSTDIFKLRGTSTPLTQLRLIYIFPCFGEQSFGRKRRHQSTYTIQIPTFFHIAEAFVHDSKTMKEIPHETGPCYIFDRAYNNFKMLYKIHQMEHTSFSEQVGLTKTFW